MVAQNTIDPCTITVKWSSRQKKKSPGVVMPEHFLAGVQGSTRHAMRDSR
jgi:hypothetical protein